MFNRRFSALRFALRLGIAWAFAWLALSGPAMAQESLTDAECEMLEDKVDDDCDGLIEIYTLSDLYNIRHNLAGTSYKTSPTDTGVTMGCPNDRCKGYELMNDLDFGANGDGRADGKDAYYNGGAGWEPIGTFAPGTQFTATFDGNGYAIANLFINRGSEDLVGLFGYVGTGGKISNLGVVDAEIVDGVAVGSLVGISAGTITASYARATTVSSTSRATGRATGGLVGFNNGTIDASYAEATTVSGDAAVGGLVGGNSGTIRASYALATVKGSDNNVGGLVGNNSGSGTVTASSAVATVTGVNGVGGLVGLNDGEDINGSYAVVRTVTGVDGVGGLVGLNRDEGIDESYAEARTVTGNERVGGLVGFNDGGDITASYARATTVRGAMNDVGGLVGLNDNSGKIIASYAVATTVTSVRGNNVGGLVGRNDNHGDIIESYAVATVSANDVVGGLAGVNGMSGDIIRSYAVATVLANDQVGGLVGASGGDITASYAVATVSADQQVGGLVGQNGSGAIAASYAVVTVTALGTGSQVGGLVGLNSGSGTIDASYAVAAVTARTDVGGLVGLNTVAAAIDASYALATVLGNIQVGGLVGNNAGTIDASYFDADITDQPPAEQGKPASDLQTPTTYTDSIYVTWDDSDLDGDGTEGDEWNFGEDDQYPALVLPLLETGACPIAVSAAVMIEPVEGECIHRPVSRIVSVELDDDRARLDGIIFTNNGNPRITAQLLLPADSTVRVVVGMTEVPTQIQTAADGRVTLTVDLVEGPNVFQAFWVRESGEVPVLLGELAITLDTMPPVLTVHKEGDGRIRAEVSDPNPLTIRYARLDRAAASTCDADFSGSGLMPYDPNPANADDRYLPALEPDGDGNVGVYCFVAEDLAGNRTVFSSAEAVPAPVAAPVALRLRLRVFLESALP